MAKLSNLIKPITSGEFSLLYKKHISEDGYIDLEINEIGIKYNLPKKEKIITLLHELFHIEKESEKFAESNAQKFYKNLNQRRINQLEFILKNRVLYRVK
jgi:hypothetical protein